MLFVTGSPLALFLVMSQPARSFFHKASLALLIISACAELAMAQRQPVPDIEQGDPFTVSAQDGLNIRMQPNATRIGAIPHGRQVYATGAARLHPTGSAGMQYWLPVRYQNESNEWINGWVYLRHVSPSETPQQLAEAAAQNRQALITADDDGVENTISQSPPTREQVAAVDRSQPMQLSINVNSRARFRSNPSLSGNILGRLTNNTNVEIIGRPQGEWIPIRVSGTNQLGWVHVSLLEAATAPMNPLELAQQHADSNIRAQEQISEYARLQRVQTTEAGTADQCDSCQGGTPALEPIRVDEPYILPLARGSFRISSGYGNRRHPRSGRWRMHHGIDFAAPRGTNVVAIRSGRVVSVQTGCRVGRESCGRGYGNHVLIDHGNGITTLYAHLSEVTVSAQATVRQGQVIGKVGTTGISTGNHLHLEIRQNGRSMNPANFLPRR